MLTLDGSQGEGGGQILRSALALSMITGTPFRIDNIRAKRSKPGLLRQHLMCVKAAQRISNARVEGAELRSMSVTFEPGPIRGGAYEFAIGTAGSTTLVMQTILPALLYADGPSHVVLQGGTHNPFAPTFDYLDRVFVPLLRQMGADVALRLHKHGFYPAGGGRWEAHITPAPLRPLKLESSGGRVSQQAVALVTMLPFTIAERETAEAVRLLKWDANAAKPRAIKADGFGNVMWVEIAHENATEQFTAFGERSVSAEEVAARAAFEAKAFLAAGVPVGPHLADQLLLPMALAGGGAFATVAPTEHTRTNIGVIGKFVPVTFDLAEFGRGRWRVSARSA